MPVRLLGSSPPSTQPLAKYPSIASLASYLPTSRAPQGDGFVSYKVLPKSTAVTGSRVDALATIIFDDNAPLDTPPIFNALDASAPTSNVLPLAETQANGLFNVRWTASDGSVGSGSKSVDVYVSENGAAYRLWLEDTELLEANYIGVAGSSYAFYTTASDKTGNQEIEPNVADAQTYVFDPFGAPSVPSIPSSSDSGISNSDHRTNQRQPQFVGTGVPGYTIVVYGNGNRSPKGLSMPAAITWFSHPAHW